jgi:hypothetical protein
MKNNGLLGELLEQGKSTLGDVGRSAKSQLTGFGKATAGQISPNLLGQTSASEEEAPGSRTEESVESLSSETEEEKLVAKEHAKEMVKHLYGLDDKEKKDKGKHQGSTADKKTQQEEKKPLSEEEKIQQLRNSLHQEYYQGLTKPKPQQEEERPAEKIEKEKEMEDLEEQEKKKKKPPELAIQRSQQKAEKFPGASG